jgi:hypothetical protein
MTETNPNILEETKVGFFILAGALLVVFGGNYQFTASITMGLGIIGGLMWLLVAIWIQKDANRVSEILKQRGIELNQKKEEKKKKYSFYL